MKPFLGGPVKAQADDSDLHFLFLTDSTGETITEWTGLFAAWLGDTYPTYDVVYYEWWNGGTETWDEGTTVSTGTGSNTIHIWCAGGSSYNPTDFTDNEVAIIQEPTAVDYVVIGIAHNNNTSAIAGFPAFDALLAMLYDNWPDAYIAFLTRNPRYGVDGPPYDGTAWEGVRTQAANWGLGGVIDVERAFVSGYEDFGESLTADGTHPNDAGKQVYLNTVTAAWTAGGSDVMSVLSSAELVYDAGTYSGSGALLDETGNSHNGTISGATFLPYSASKYIWFPGSGSNNKVTFGLLWPSSASTVEWIARVYMPDWTPGSISGFMGGTAARAYFRILTNGTLVALINDGSSNYATASSETVPATDGDTMWLRAVWDLTLSGTNDVLYYTSADDTDDYTAVSWTQLGTVQSSTKPNNTINPMSVNSIGDTRNTLLQPMTGGVHRAVVKIDGSVFYDVYAADATRESATFTERGPSAKEVTIGQHGSGYRTTVVSEPQFVLSTDDYVYAGDDAALDFAADESFTAFAVIDVTDVTPSADLAVLAKKADLSTAAGWAIYVDTANGPTGIIADGSGAVEATSGALTSNTKQVVAFKRDVAADTITMYTDGVAGTPVTDSTTATLANAEQMRVGRLSGAGENYFEGGAYDFVVFRSALSDAGVAAVGDALLASYDVSEAATLHGDGLWAWMLSQEGGRIAAIVYGY